MNPNEEINELRNQVRGLVTRFLDEAQVPKVKSKVECPQEVILHQKALELHNSQGMTYKDAYISLFRDLEVMIHEGIHPSQALDHILNNRVGWNHIHFDGHYQQERKNIINLTKPLEVVEGLYTCPQCKSKKTHSYSRQVRSADEPATTFISCVNRDCQFKWKIN